MLTLAALSILGVYIFRFCAESEKRNKAVRVEKAVGLQYKHAVEKHQEVTHGRTQ